MGTSPLCCGYYYSKQQYLTGRILSIDLSRVFLLAGTNERRALTSTAGCQKVPNRGRHCPHHLARPKLDFPSFLLTKKSQDESATYSFAKEDMCQWMLVSSSDGAQPKSWKSPNHYKAWNGGRGDDNGGNKICFCKNTASTSFLIEWLHYRFILHVFIKS